MDVNGFFNGLSGRLEPSLQTHLKNVYASVCLSTGVAAVGGFLHVFTGVFNAGLLTGLASMGFMLALMFTADNGKNVATRLAYLAGFSLCTGMSMGPLLQYSSMLEPSLISTALLLTSAIFASFSVAALMARRRQMLFLGGFLGSALMVLLALSLANLFFKSQLIFQAELYGGVLVMSGFILYDTQLIMERHRAGDKDFIWHALMLFVDLVAVFRRILVILTSKESDAKKKRRN